MFYKEGCPDFKISDWDFDNNNGPRYFILRAQDLAGASVKPISGVTFKDCDFHGLFETQLIFKNCTFDSCDLGLSTFRRAKFTNCTFIDTSFSQAVFENCEFRICSYCRISFSGNETQIPKTLITEPHRFIFGGQAAVGNVPDDKSALVQKLRFEETRSTLSRTLLANLQSEGSEDTYYAAVRTASICEDRARLAGSILQIVNVLEKKSKKGLGLKMLTFFLGFLRAVSAAISLVVLSLMGFLNGWGGNVSRVLLIGAILILSLSYRMSYKFSVPYSASLVKLTEVFLLFGYTNHVRSGAEDFSLLFATALLGVFWYALAIPTIVNRLTRLRG